MCVGIGAGQAPPNNSLLSDNKGSSSSDGFLLVRKEKPTVKKIRVRSSIYLFIYLFIYGIPIINTCTRIRCNDGQTEKDTSLFPFIPTFPKWATDAPFFESVLFYYKKRHDNFPFNRLETNTKEPKLKLSP